MKKFGLIGFPLEHSFSKKFFSEKFEKEGISNCRYDNYSLEKIELLNNLVRENTELIGLNVTIPYKQAVIPFLDEMDDDADEIGAVNTIRIYRDQKSLRLKGYNTDVYGFEKPLIPVLKGHHKKALILGTGGASKAVAHILKKYSVDYKYVSRNPKNPTILTYRDLTPEIIEQCNIIVNTSPLGMFPNLGEKPDIPYDNVGKQHILYDLIYNPEKTLFLKEGEERNATIINGLPMLHIQAEKAWEIWNT